MIGSGVYEILADFRCKKQCLRCLLAIMICLTIFGIMVDVLILGVLLYLTGNSDALD